MKFYLMRHCEAESGLQMDPTRKLTDTGKRQAKLMGKWLNRQDVPQPELLLQSNFRRSRSTAKRIGQQLDLEPITCGWLDPENHPELVWPRIKALAAEHKAESVLAVSHGPLVEKLLALLTTAQQPTYMTFAHGAIAHLTTTGGMRGQLHWICTPNTVARDEGEMEDVTSDAARVAEAAIDVVTLALRSC